MSMEIFVEPDSQEIRKRMFEMIPGKAISYSDREILSFQILHLSSLLCPISKSKLINRLIWVLGSLFEKEIIGEFVNKHLDHQNQLDYLYLQMLSIRSEHLLLSQVLTYLL